MIPHEVISATVDGATPARAWREYLQLTQAEVAQRLRISQPSYARQESSGRLRPQTLSELGAGMGILPEQLDF
ncbi:helix-turn-helix domain-containing protein [Pseudoduganella ginsengisoli]|uniref:helix-turn-helix domain-containing protein n=1 Tax=Pseudoduganella ginsengisoli TaxID=1462440 RepID=UPI001E4FC5CE|nr:helix-turn-helix transcriptional regulator [Pseudoduganella ginsengisoli]